ncbi:MAG: alpha/beta fold hydrolase [Caldilineaceae bacterium]|nr:alpha/beta fold hydrolase [Caldilineaceae bacterium]
MPDFTGPMQPWPALEPFARRVELPRQGLTLFTYEAGDPAAPPALLIHGLGDEADTWRGLIPRLAVTHRVIAPDLPGFGRSDQPKVAYTPAYHQQALSELMDVLALDKVRLLGNSLGGMLAHSLTLKQPQRVARLALLDGSLAAGGGRPSLGQLLFALPLAGEYLYNRLRKDPDAAYASLRPFYFDLDALPQADQAFLYQRVNERVWSGGQRRAYFSTLRSAAFWQRRMQKGLDTLLAAVATPTLAIWGEADQIVSPAGGQTVTQMQPNARLITIARAGHLPQQERPDAVMEALAHSWLAP